MPYSDATTETIAARGEEIYTKQAETFQTIGLISTSRKYREVLNNSTLRGVC